MLQLSDSLIFWNSIVESVILVVADTAFPDSISMSRALLSDSATARSRVDPIFRRMIFSIFFSVLPEPDWSANAHISLSLIHI